MQHDIDRQHVRAIGRRLAFLAVLALALALALPAPRPASAGILPATIAVTTTTIEDDPNNGACSLYEALMASFTSAAYHECAAGSDTTLIVFAGAAAGGTIIFPGKPNDVDLPMINKDVTITGPITLDGNGGKTDQHIFRIAPGGTLNLAAMVLRNTHTSGGGGAILDNNHGTINVAGVSFTGNVAEGDGGAINSNGTVNVVGSNFAGNKALGVMPDQVTNNPATGYGGAIHIDGANNLKIAASNFSGNVADKGGGALHFDGDSADISDAIFSGNIVNGTGSGNSAPQGGGAILNGANATLALTRDAFNGNLTPTGSGGALFAQIGATVGVTSSSFNGNVAASPGNSAAGGAIYNQGAHLAIDRATFLNNAVLLGDGGALANDRHGDATISNTSFTANAAASGSGGAIDNTNSQQGGPASSVVAKNVTFSANAASSSAGHGGAIFNANGHSVALGNTIVDGSVGDNCTGAIASLGHNLESANTCGLSQAGDQANADPKLDTPGFNGGPIASLLTQKLLAGSQAIDAGDPAICAAPPVNNADQRDDPRPKGAACDIGSFESDPLVAGYGSTPVQPGPISFGNTVVGTPLDATFSIFETGNATLHVSNPQLSGPNAADFAVKAPSPFPLDIADGGPSAQVALTCTPAVVGARAATLTLDTNDPARQHVAYTLQCNGTVQPAPSYTSTPSAPGPIDLGGTLVNTPLPGSLTVGNVGDASLTVNQASPALGGANPADFSVQTPFPLTLSPSLFTNIAIQCKPSAIGIRTATLTLTTNDPNRPAVAYNLACQGDPIPPPIFATPGESLASPIGGSSGVYGVATSPDGRNVYVTDVVDNLVTVYGRDTTTGKLTFLQNKVDGFFDAKDLKGPYLVTVSADGKNVYVASSASSAIVSFLRAPDGRLTFLKSVKKGDPYFCFPVCNQLNALNGAYGIALSPDGQYGYVSSIGDNSITVLARNASTGALELGPLGPVQVYTSASISQAYGIALSPDGAYLYITGYLSDNVEVLKRDPNSGMLTFVERQTNLQNGVDGLDGVFRVTVSPDGAFAYTASFNNNAITVFKRDQSTGKLAYVTNYQDSVSHVDGLALASSVTISSDGAYLFATGYGGNAVAVFERDQLTGKLIERQVIKRDAGTGLPALGGARDTAISPDGRTLYVTGYADNKVVALHRANPTPVATSLAPASATAGGGAFTLAVNGSGFMPGSTIYWGATARATTFVNSTQVTASLPASDIASVGQVAIKVVNPAPGGGDSNTLSFTISAPNANPVPAATTLAPASANAGGAAFTLTVNGSGFMPSSTVRWNGANRATTYVSATKLTAQIGAADIAQPGPAGVTVANPAPGGGASNAITFDIAAPGENPTPSISSIAPGQIMADVASADDITLLIAGGNFTAESQGQWNGANRPTVFVSATQLRMTVTAADLAAGGHGSVTVVNPAPGGGTSNTATFTIISIKTRVQVAFIKR